MRRSQFWLVLVAVALVLGLAAQGRTMPQRLQAVTPWKYRFTEDDARRDGARVLTREMRDGGFRFAAGTAAVDRQAFLQAISTGIRPDATRLVATLDGLVIVRFDKEERGAFGHAGPRSNGSFELLLDLPFIHQQLGPRGLRQVAMHELGHVVDFALLTPDVRDRLDAQIPVGYQCPPGTKISACAPREERFAETFAKWSTGDLGNGLYAGYGVMPPRVPFDQWGAPLSALAGH
jgi:hypothetical protein